ncbi:MAG TPA: LysR family transcriptional regulator [Clostridiales bacterium]|nr:LysR family transcriptional regulator [Clostridiales bacterium]
MTLQQLRYVISIAKNKSMNKAAEELFVSQPSLSSSIKDLEDEIGIELFLRTNRGVLITPEGTEFLGYARQMLEQYSLIEDRYINKRGLKNKFSVSMQHYTFAVEAFIYLAKEYGMDDFEFAVYETKTYEVIENVKNQKSEIGLLYLNDFNEKAIKKVLNEKQIEFIELFKCNICVYISKNNPLAKKSIINFEDLKDYPCLSFEQGDYNSFYFAEEVFSTYDYKKIIKASDRATMLNLMVGLNGYTLCSGIICEELNGDEYVAIPLNTDDTMTIGYIKKNHMPLSKLGKEYVEKLEEYENKRI